MHHYAQALQPQDLGGKQINEINETTEIKFSTEVMNDTIDSQR